ncbi:MAG: phosphatase PAP2 family protein [Lachnospiraceae bacterium]|nr:phosphatase PAP2 family protein [Lachnospiraceae bacterium]
MKKKTIMAVPKVCFIGVVIACILGIVFVLIYGYNRIHMTNHFLSDVCFGTLITYLIFSVISTAFEKSRI